MYAYRVQTAVEWKVLEEHPFTDANDSTNLLQVADVITVSTLVSKNSTGLVHIPAFVINRFQPKDMIRDDLDDVSVPDGGFA
jgi:hypothetical protein